MSEMKQGRKTLINTFPSKKKLSDPIMYRPELITEAVNM
jgi:hypothetical protein